MKWLEKKIIYGCESDNTAGVPYLIRWKLLGLFGYSLLLHKFVRSDGPDFHDHPWAYTSLILKGGYMEYVATMLPNGEPGTTLVYWRCPGTLTSYPANHLHRVELYSRNVSSDLATDFVAGTLSHVGRQKKEYTPCWTLVLHGPYVRQWQFWDVAQKQFVHWKDYFLKKGC